MAYGNTRFRNHDGIRGQETIQEPVGERLTRLDESLLWNVKENEPVRVTPGLYV